MFQTKRVERRHPCRQPPKNTNSRYKNFTQEIYTAGDIDQFNSSRVYESLKMRTPKLAGNLFENKNLVTHWFKNADITSEEVENTFKYFFYKFKKGIFVRISDKNLVTFLPFTNAHYRNEFSDKLLVDPSFLSVQTFLDYVSRKIEQRRKTQQHIPLNEWVPNNALMRYEYRQSEGDNNVVILNHLMKTLCERRDLPDIEFFINRRDFPQMKTNSTEPYNHIYDSPNHPLVSHNYRKYSPVLSCSSTNGFADILMPTFEDWARAQYQDTGDVFPNACREYPIIQHSAWSTKISKAVFRGATTGAGFNEKTNQRLRALKITSKRPDLFDFGITKWNLRPRKYEGEQYLRTIELPEYPRAGPLTLQQQSKYKYILNLEGHVAAYRLSYEFSSGSVVLLAASRWKMWYSGMIRPFVHYVPVAEDLSDLVSQVEWCRSNDDKCREIATNAQLFYDRYLGKKGILDFLQKELWEISTKAGAYEYFPDLLQWSIENEKQQLVDQLVFSDKLFKYDMPPGPRCIGRLDGLCEVMRSKSINDLQLIKNISTNANGSIDLFKTNNAWIVGKKANNPAKILEHVHESYIGLNAINNLVGKIPNFMYVFGPAKDAKDMVFSEYVTGTTFFDWLQSPNFNTSEFLMILLQINLALSVAQTFTGFIHYDLYPWNVIIQKIQRKVKFTYFVEIGKVLTIETDIIPVIIDYGKSRVVVHEKDFGLVDHGFANLYRTSRIIDTLTLLYSSLNILKARPGLDHLSQYGLKIGLPHASDIKFNSQFGSMFESVDTLKGVRPIDFIDFIVSHYPAVFQSVLKNPGTFPDKLYMTEKGNPVQTSMQMLHGDENTALFGVIEHINKSRPPISTDAFFQHVITNMLERRLLWIDDEVEIKGNNAVKTAWSTLRKIFEYQPTPTTNEPFIDYPTPQQLYIDGFMSPSRVRDFTNEGMLDDWKKIWTLYVEAYLFKVVQNTGTLGAFIQIDGFEYMNAISSHNLLRKLQMTLLPPETSILRHVS